MTKGTPKFKSLRYNLPMHSFALAGLLLIAALLPLSSQAAVEFDRLDDTTLYFKNSDGTPAPAPLKTELFDLKFQGIIKPAKDDANGLSYFMFSGRPCKSCVQDQGLFVFRPTGGRPTAFVHPGKIFDHKSRALVLESRAFIGRCLPRNPASIYVVFQHERVDRRKGMQASVFIAEAGADYIEEKLLERHLPRIKDTLSLVKSKACREIEGRNRLMLTRPLDVNLRRTPRDDDDDDEAEDKKTIEKAVEKSS